MRKPKVCLELEELEYPVRLEQTGRNKFNVVYGLQVKEGLTYEQAALELGSCIMHALACASKLCND